MLFCMGQMCTRLTGGIASVNCVKQEQWMIVYLDLEFLAN